MGFTVAIVGRPNVGKSTLFNRLIGERQAIVDDFSGVTRDRQYGVSTWNGKHFNVIDTGGFVQHSDDLFEKAIRTQVHIAIEEASLILFMVDVSTGITDLDDQMVAMLRRTSKPTFLVVNKVDNNARRLEANEFYSLGMEHTFFLSSINGSGSGEMLDAMAEFIPAEEEKEESEIPKLAIVGQPNVGKSSLLNVFLGEERNIVTNIAGTTRDSIHTYYNKFDKEFLLIDTAGIRKKSKVHEDLEFYSVIRAINAIDEADVVLLVIDAQMGIESQDMKIISLAEKKKKGLMILVNKWDLIEDKENRIKEMKEQILRKMQPFNDLPVLFISALEKKRVFRVIEEALKIFERRGTRITTSKLNDYMLEVIQRNGPPSIKGKYVQIKYVMQLPLAYPAFAFFCNLPQYVKPPYKNFLENKIREKYDFTGVPMAIFIRKK